MGIRVVAIDIDGTVTDMKRRLIWPGVEAIRAVEAAGIPVIPTTGNVYPVTRAFASFVGTSGPLVCENGGLVVAADGTRKTLLHERRKGDEAFEHLRRQGVAVKKIWSDPWRESEVALQLNVDADDVRRHLDGWGLDVVPTRFAIHLMAPGLNKLAGLTAALGMMGTGVGLGEVLAVGDALNDVEILRACGYSAAVGNAMPEARQAAQFVARADHGDGVREAFEHFGLLKASPGA